jgi:hypothetical protein
MFRQLATILHTLLQRSEETWGAFIFDPVPQLDETRTDELGIAQSLNAAFLIALTGADHPAAERANRLLDEMAASSKWATVKWATIAGFYQKGIEFIRQELATVCEREPDFGDRLRGLAEWIATPDNLLETTATQERIWSVFFPEGAGIRHKEEQRVDVLRQRRHVEITQLNNRPISHPTRQILFTSNVLLTLPAASIRLDQLGLGDHLSEQLRRACDEPQLFWYDHPIQIGVEPQANEVLHGLRGLQSTLEFERDRGNVPRDARLTCILSVSVTHQGLQGLAKRYLAEEFAHAGGFANLDVFVFTEKDTQSIVDEILVPAAEHYLKRTDAKDLLDVIGVDGHYGRHYSFLKAIAAFWSVFIDPETKATFKIDLDQVFPQRELVEQSDNSAFEHFTTPLWGARGVDADGRPLELGMIAGAVVNERDIATSLFTPDVRFPNHVPAMDECVFFSRLPQSLSTEAEMMTRYDTNALDGETGALDGETGCIQRIHVTGGMNGILVDSLRRHRPFTPSFIGRAEDQAYLLSAMLGSADRLACVHKPGLIMRHDKEAFAQEALAAAHVGQLIGDYERILYFSAYAGVLADDKKKVKDMVDPFTGCFVSMIPTTVTYLRFALKCASLFQDGNTDQALQFVTLGTRRVAEALSFVRGANSELMKRYERERRGWDIYYDTLSAIETALKDEDAFAVALRHRAQETIAGCHIGDSS